MTFEQIRAYITVVRIGSITKAAEELFLNPSTLSYQLKTLEDELGFCLLSRSSSGVEPTETGAFLADQFEKSLNTFNYAIERAKIQKYDIRNFTLGFTCSYSYEKIGHVADILRKKYNTLQMRIIPIDLKSPLKPLLEGSADALVTYDDYVRNHEDIVFYPIEKRDVFCIAKRGKLHSENGAIALDDVIKLPILFPPDLDRYPTLKQTYREVKQIAPEAQMVLTMAYSFQEQLRHLEADEGVAFVHATNAQIALGSPGLEAFRLEGFSHTIGLCWLNNGNRDVSKSFAKIWDEYINSGNET